MITKLPNKPYDKPISPHWYDSIPLSHLIILEELRIFNWSEIPSTAKLAMVRDDHEISPYLPINADLLRLLGYFTSEGYIRDEGSCYQTNFSVPHPALHDHVKQLIINVFNSDPYEKTDNGQLVHTGRIHAYLFAYAWNLGKGAYQKRIPSFILTLPDTLRFEFLSAFIDGDGTIPNNDQQISLYSVSKLLLQDFTILLLTLGFFARKREPTPIGHYGAKILARYKELGKKPKMNQVHRISLRGKDLSILEKLNFIHPMKKKRSKEILSEGFYSERKIRTLSQKYQFLDEYKDLIFDKVQKIEHFNKTQSSYCLEVQPRIESSICYHNITLSNALVLGQCDGDEDGIMLLLECLLNFSKFYLPSSLGGKMDAPLVVSVLLDPREVDGESHNCDYMARYPLQFYEESQKFVKPSEIEKFMVLYKHKLDTPAQFEGAMFTHPTDSIHYGPRKSTYSMLETMEEKIESQMHLAKTIVAVDAQDVARKVIASHFAPDILGNLRAFSTQTFRCPKCSTKYRRVPLMGKCIECGNDILMTVHPGGITKYLPRAKKFIQEFDLGHYTEQRWDIIERNVTSLTNNPKVKQKSLKSFFK